MAAASSPDPRGRPPEDLDELVEWFDRYSAGLVLLATPPIEEVRAAIEAVDAAVRRHLEDGSRARARRPPVPERLRDGISADHRRFPTSVDQLWWFFRIVEADDHGGHRQALGQYGRLVAEALRRHRAEERAAVPGQP